MVLWQAGFHAVVAIFIHHAHVLHVKPDGAHGDHRLREGTFEAIVENGGKVYLYNGAYQ